MFFKYINKNFTHKSFSLFGIKIKFISKEYKNFKKYFYKSLVKDYGNNNVVTLKPLPVADFGGGATSSKLRIKFYGNYNTVFIALNSHIDGVIEIFGDNNVITIADNVFSMSSAIVIGSKDAKTCNSKLTFSENVNFQNSSIQIKDGNNQYFYLGENTHIYNSKFILSGDTVLNFGKSIQFYESKGFTLQRKANVFFGNNTTCNSVFANLAEGSSLNIGEDCMLSWEIVFLPHDLHTIIDNNGNILNNKNYEINIGKHCWLGYRSKFIHNAKIKENSIIGIGSLVNKKFNEPGVIIAGVPARIVKRDINWARASVNDYINLNKTNN